MTTCGKPYSFRSVRTISRTYFYEVTYPYDAELSDEVTIRPGDLIEVDVDEKHEVSLWLRGRKRDHACKRGSSDSFRLSEGYFYRAFATQARTSSSSVVFGVSCVSTPKHMVFRYKEKDYFAAETPGMELECTICKNLADEPHQTGCCGHTVCFKCADEWRKTSNSCPYCREEPLDLAKDTRTKRFIDSLTVCCSHYESGCEWKGSISELQSHLQSRCLYEDIPCGNEGCSMKVMRRNIDDHMKKTCSMRRQPCPCCQIMFTYSKIITTHYKHCPSWPKRCPNHCGTDEEKLMRSTLQDHIDNNCPQQVISCQFAEAGCTVRVKRSEMADHIQKAVGEHMTAMMSDYVKVKKEHGNLQKDCNTLKKEHCNLRKDYNALKKDHSVLKKDCELLKSRLATLERSQGT